MAKDEVFPNYQKKLKKELDADRYEHTIGVAYTAAALAMRRLSALTKITPTTPRTAIPRLRSIWADCTT